MGRPKKSVPSHVEPEDASQEEPDEEPAVVIESTPIGSMSKADACRAALAAGIEDAEKAQEFTRSKFGVEIKATDFALYKSKAKQAAAPAKAEPAKRGRKPKSNEPAVTHIPAAPRAATNGEPDLLESLETLKPLIAAMGAEKVHRLVDLLG
jgi:hypothetical protein